MEEMFAQQWDFCILMKNILPTNSKTHQLPTDTFSKLAVNYRFYKLLIHKNYLLRRQK